MRKHLAAAGITRWGDFSRESLYEFHDLICGSLAPSSAKTVSAYLKSLLNRYQDALELPIGWEKIIAVKASKPTKTYLTEKDLEKLERVRPRTKKQEFVKNVFLICAFTGLRVGDALRVTPQNIVDGNLHFVAEKTRKAGAIPLKKGLEEKIRWVSEHLELKVSLPSYNEAIRSLCRRAGIDEEVVVYKAGKERRGPKWMFISSHTARVSTASCLDRRGVPIGDISRLLQHSGVGMTERYIVRDHIELSENAMEFFN